ncbi:YncE family protein, partial [Streptomyces sp. F001]|uniref:YncE family protein n=1 Tax=Streptomyces sp. F001 TaxID=1510026 RepID=UPI0010D21FCB
NTATNRKEGNPIPVGRGPTGVAVSPNEDRVYVTNFSEGSVSVINTATNRKEGKPIPVGRGPLGVVVSPIEDRVYVANFSSDSVSVIPI